MLPILNQQSSEGQLTSHTIFRLGNSQTAFIPAPIPTRQRAQNFLSNIQRICLSSQGLRGKMNNY